MQRPELSSVAPPGTASISAPPQLYSAGQVSGYTSAPMAHMMMRQPTGAYDLSQQSAYGGYSSMMPPTMMRPMAPRPMPTVISSLPRPSSRVDSGTATLAPLPLNEKPQTTVYVGKIAPSVDDVFLKRVLGLCGHIKSWKRAQDPTSNAPKKFGFCEFETAEGVLRAMRLLNKFSLDNQELVLNVTQGTRDYLERYVNRKKATVTGPRLDLSDLKKLLEVAGEDWRKDEESAPAAEKKTKTKVVKEVLTEEQRKSLEAKTFGLVLISDKTGDESALGVINSLLEEREKAIEAEIERVASEAGKAEAEAPMGSSDAADKGGVQERLDASLRKVDSGADREGKKAEPWPRDREKERTLRDGDRMYYQKERDWEKWEKEKERERQYDRERVKERERERRKQVKLQEELSDDEEYRHRFRHFGEDQKRRRLREEEDDDMDRMREEKEAEEAKKRRVEEERDIPVLKAAGMEALRAIAEERLRDSSPVAPSVSSLLGSSSSMGEDSAPPVAAPRPLSSPPSSPPLPPPPVLLSEDSMVDLHEALLPFPVTAGLLRVTAAADAKEREEAEGTPKDKDELKKKLGFNLPGSGKRTLMPAFAREEEEDEGKTEKRRTLVPIDYGEDEKGRKAFDYAQGSGLGSSLAAAAEFARKLSQKGPAEKPMDAKTLIDSIPTDKEELFGFDLNWSVYDKHNLQEKVKPWVAKKVKEYLGEEERSLVEFIVANTKKHVSAQEMLEQVEAILDEEAEKFVLKMWRMLIFEVRRIETGLAGAGK